MATKLTKPVTRVISTKDINGVVGDVEVTISESGLSFHKGRRKFPSIPWEAIEKLVRLPGNIPGKYAANPIGWLVELSNKN